MAGRESGEQERGQGGGQGPVSQRHPPESGGGGQYYWSLIGPEISWESNTRL